MKTLLFTYDTTTVPSRAGRELLAELNKQTLKDLIGADLVEQTCQSRKPAGVVKKINALFGWLDGLDRRAVEQCKCLITEHGIEAVYIEGSNYGRLAQEVRSAFPQCKIICFFHNVESKFFLDAFKSRPSIRAAAVMMANFLAERLAVKHSDRIICLNDRDSELLARLYGRGATNISPLCLGDTDSPLMPSPLEATGKRIAIFVGGAFYSNVRGIQWYAKHVAPRLECTTYVIGKGFERYRHELERYGNIEVVGYVDSVDDWYERASVVVAPIFDGSGMKTKVAEALRYGRPVVGTTEAFVGYEPNVNAVGFVCDTADEFVARIGSVLCGATAFDPPRLRGIYERCYSLAAAHNYMSTALRFDYGERFPGGVASEANG